MSTHGGCGHNVESDSGCDICHDNGDALAVCDVCGEVNETNRMFRVVDYNKGAKNGPDAEPWIGWVCDPICRGG